MRGPKPKPTNLKILEGDQPCRINYNEPVLPFASTDAPQWLTGEALAHWNELAPVLSKAGLLTEGDRGNLALLCESWGQWRADSENFKAKDLYRRLSTEFGMTPSSRSRIKSTVEKPKDKLEELISSRPPRSKSSV